MSTGWLLTAIVIATAHITYMNTNSSFMRSPDTLIDMSMSQCSMIMTIIQTSIIGMITDNSFMSGFEKDVKRDPRFPRIFIKQFSKITSY